MKHLAQMLIVFSLISCTTLQAQQTIAASGGNVSGTGGTVSYTIGQVAYVTHINSSGTVTQGCQQPYEILVLTGLEEAKGITIECMVYPNPSSDFVMLTVFNYETDDLGFRLYDSDGRLIQSKRITNKETIIEIGNLPPAFYYLNIYDSRKEIKTFKIIKNQ
jgi:Secretion system C-terminal sorting domain